MSNKIKFELFAIKAQMNSIFGTKIDYDRISYLQEKLKQIEYRKYKIRKIFNI